VRRNTVKNINKNYVNILNGVGSIKQKEEKQEKRGKKKKKRKVGHLHIYWKENMVLYQTVRQNYFYEKPLLYCRNFSLQKYQLQR
jgi:hypothetical protein